MLKFRVGDTVVIRDDLVLDQEYGSMVFDETYEDLDFLGEKFTIIQTDEQDSTYEIDIDGEGLTLWISQEMIEYKTDYQQGDLVRIREDLQVRPRGSGVVDQMLRYRGLITTVSSCTYGIRHNYQILNLDGLDGGSFNWNDWMVEPCYEVTTADTITADVIGADTITANTFTVDGIGQTFSMRDLEEAIERMRPVASASASYGEPIMFTTTRPSRPSSRKVTCEHCGKEMSIDEAKKTHDGDYICDECAESKYVACEDCGRYVLKEDSLVANRVKKRTICPSCFNANYYKCTDCGLIERKRARRMNPNGEYICSSCFEASCTICNNCGDTIWLSEAHTNSRGTKLCTTCYRGRIILNYHGFSNWVLRETGNETRNSKVPMGIELEVERTRSSVRREAMAWKCKDALGDLAVYENDGSLNDGFEIITHPMSYDYWVNNADSSITQALGVLNSAGYNSHDTETCGLHVHVSKESLATESRSVDDVIDNIILIMETFKAELTAFSRRGSSQLGRWAQFLTSNYDDVNLYYIKQIKNNESRYRALNLQKGATIEFRIFKGTLIKETLYASLELVKNIVNIAKFEELDSLTWNDIIGYDSDVNKYITQYNQSRGISSDNKIHILDRIEAEKDKFSLKEFIDGKFAINCEVTNRGNSKADILEYLIVTNCGYMSEHSKRVLDVRDRNGYCNLNGYTIRFVDRDLSTGTRHSLKTIGLDRILQLWTDHKELLQCA